MQLCNRKVTTKTDLFLDNEPLEYVDSYKDLGFVIDSRLTFDAHYKSLSAKSYRIINYIFRYFKTRSPEFLTRMFKTNVRPILEYGSQCSYPRTAKNVRIIEKIQRHYLKRIPSCSTLDYAESMVQCELDSIEIRRIKADLKLLYKILYGFIDLKFSELFVFAPSDITRSSCLKLHKPMFKTDIRKFSFPVRIVNIWNKLPSFVKLASGVRKFSELLDDVTINSLLLRYTSV